MSRRIFLLVYVAGSVLFAAATVAFGAEAGRWARFHSTDGFSIQYPENWYRKGISMNSLMILSLHSGADAVLIKQGEAMILVREDDRFQTLAEFIRYFTKGTNVLSDLALENRGGGSSSCRSLQRVVSKEGIIPQKYVPGPVPMVINTDFFCEIYHRKFVVALRNFEGDKKQSLYQMIALRMAKSVRAGPSGKVIPARRH